jgi:hypothetical protein
VSDINNGLAVLLKDYEAHKPSLPAPAQTPPPERVKVVEGPVLRKPVNKQAALLLRPVRAWEFQPPPMPPEELNTPERQEIKRLTAELKTERNDHALTRDDLGRARQDIRTLRQWLEEAHEQCRLLRLTVQEKNEVIRQLEDIKL